MVSGALATPIVVSSASTPSIAACSAPDAASARPGESFDVVSGPNSSRSAGAEVPWLRRRTARTASEGGTNRPPIVPIVPDTISDRTSRTATPAARAISRAVKTSGAEAVTDDMEQV
jgi:hypothetical protein